jgi:S-adenosylmethionine synthetase
MLVTHGTFSSEAVSSGHPDKIADQISDAILDACLAQDPAACVAMECAIKGDLICLMCEITADARINAPEIARQVLRDVGDAGARGALAIRSSSARSRRASATFMPPNLAVYL